VKYLLGEASAEEERSVKEWIESDAVNRRYFEHFQLIWTTSKQLAAQSTADENLAWQRFQTRVQKGKEVQLPVARRKFLWTRIAASIVLIIGIGLIGYFVNNRQPKQLTLLAEKTTFTDTLPDGSVVTLNKHSLLAYAEEFRGKKREVVLKGEAFFNVAPNKNKPFVIDANNLQITVVGTSFNVKAGLDGMTEVVVETGIVKVTKGDKTIELRPGERITIDTKDSALQKTEVTDKLYNYYRTRDFVCDNTPLWKLVDVLNEAYDTNIIIADEKLKTEPVNSVFYNRPLDEILEVIQKTLRLSIKRRGDQIILNYSE
jgi:transmembrane sensor